MSIDVKEKDKKNTKFQQNFMGSYVCTNDYE